MKPNIIFGSNSAIGRSLQKIVDPKKYIFCSLNKYKKDTYSWDLNKSLKNSKLRKFDKCFFLSSPRYTHTNIAKKNFSKEILWIKNIIEHIKIKKFIYISSSSVYKTNHPVGKFKKKCENLLLKNAKKFEIIQIWRPFNIINHNQSFLSDHLHNQILKSYIKNEINITLFGSKYNKIGYSSSKKFSSFIFEESSKNKSFIKNYLNENKIKISELLNIFEQNKKNNISAIYLNKNNIKKSENKKIFSVETIKNNENQKKLLNDFAKNSFTMKKFCSICFNEFTETLDLGDHPCADTFIGNKKTAINLKSIPLKVGFCDNCSHLESINFVSEYDRYQKYNYSYTSSNSPVSKKHFYDIAKKICKKFKLNNSSLVVEAGSNDGTFLKNCRKISNVKVIGFEPSKNITEIAKRNNIPTINDYFNLKVLSKKNINLKADIFYCANVFNHTDYIHEFIKTILKILKKKGKIVIEVPSLESLIKSVGFDTIYHEHRQYFSLHSIKKLLNQHNIKIIKVEKINYMSGSLRIYASRGHKDDKKTKKIITQKKFLEFKKNITKIRNYMKTFIKRYNKKIIAIGAATKGNTFLNFCRIDHTNIKFVMDTSSEKIGKFLPKSGIQVINEKLDIEKKYKALLILPWNISDYLFKKFKKKKIKVISLKIISDNIKSTSNDKNRKA